METEHLWLCKIDIERDLDGFAGLMSNRDSVRYLGNRTMDRSQTWRHIAMVLGHWQILGYGWFSMIEKETGAWVGRTGHWSPPGWPTPEVGWAVHPDHLRKGYGREAGRACIDYAFEKLGWDEVIHIIVSGNTPSMRLAESLGSPQTGEMPFGVPAVTSEPCLIFGQNRDEWNARRA